MPQYVITTAAGTGSPGSGGDGGAATSAAFKYLSGLAMDAFDNLYVADSNDCKIRVVNSTTGIIKTYAGTGMQGSSGDGGQAISALLNQPQAVAVDISRGSVFIADTGNGKIRIVTSDGTITTFAGSGYASSNTYDCAATSAQLVNPASLAVDSVGNVYIGTGNPYGSNNFQVLVVAHGTGFITLFAGTGGSNSYMSPPSYGDPATSTLLYLPTGIAVDSSFNLYIATASLYILQLSYRATDLETLDPNEPADRTTDG